MARNMPEALQQVRDDLGEHAVILSTRQLRRNSRFNMHDEARVEVTAAFDEAPAYDKVSGESGESEGRSGLHRDQQAAFEGSSSPPLEPRSGVTAPASFIAQRYASSQEDREIPAPQETAAPAPSFTAAPPPPGECGQPAGGNSPLVPGEMRAGAAELEEISRQLQRLQEGVARMAKPEGRRMVMPAALERLIGRLENVGLAGALIDQLIQRLCEEFTGKTLADPGKVGERAAALFVRMMPEYRDIKIGRRRKVIGFFGAAGSGKTTAAAKIAAGFAMKRGERIILVSADDRRVGALDQVRAFSQIIGVPFEVAFSEDEMRAVLERCPEARLVLIDPSGCGPSDRGELERQRRLFAAAGVDEVQVVIDAKSSLDHMLDQIEASAEFPERRLLFTKMDEVRRAGAVLSAAASTQVPASYFTTGATVPGEIEAGKLSRLVAKTMGISSVSPRRGQ